MVVGRCSIEWRACAEGAAAQHVLAHSAGGAAIRDLEDPLSALSRAFRARVVRPYVRGAASPHALYLLRPQRLPNPRNRHLGPLAYQLR